MKFFPGLTNPFHKDSVNDFNAFVSIEQSIRHKMNAAQWAERKASLERSSSDESGKEETSTETETETGVMTTKSANYNPYSIDGIRAEINEEAATGGHDSAYDRKVSVMSCASLCN